MGRDIHGARALHARPGRTVRKAGKVCRKSGCPGVVRDGVCSVCGTERGTSAQRGYGYRWQQLRARYLRAHPLCVACRRKGSVVAATDVDHIRPRSDGGSDDDSNLQALCHACHSAKTFSGG